MTEQRYIGNPDEQARFKRILDVIETERAHESVVIMLALIAMMVDGLQTFHRISPKSAIAAALEHLAKNIRRGVQPS